MSSVQEKQAKLVNALIKSSQNGKIKWEPWEEEPGCVVTRIGDKFIYLSEHRQDETDSIKLEIYADGILTDSFLDDNLSTADEPSITNENWYLTMTALLQKARRLATGADDALDSLLKDLGA